MGFSAPKPDPKLQAQQDAAAAQAKRDKVSTIQQQLSNENSVRTKLYGLTPTGPYANFGHAPPGQDPAVTQGLRGLFQNIWTGQL